MDIMARVSMGLFMAFALVACDGSEFQARSRAGGEKVSPSNQVVEGGESSNAEHAEAELGGLLDEPIDDEEVAQASEDDEVEQGEDGPVADEQEGDDEQQNGGKAGSNKAATQGSVGSNGQANDPETDIAQAKLELPPSATHEQKAIAKCLSAWRKHPFDNSVFKSYRRIAGSISVLRTKGYALKDTEVTSEPKLILVFATIGLASKADYLFMNPNGWYCIDADVNILAKSRIDLHCNARLADTKVNIDLLSHTDGDRSKFGLSVLSKVTVNRVSRVDPKEGC